MADTHRQVSLASSIKHDDSITAVPQIPSNLSTMNADQICDAFLSSEGVYVQEGLRLLSEHFEKRLRCHNQENCPILTEIEIDSIFLNIGGIFAVNSRLYKELLAARLAGNLTSQFGLIMTQMIPYFKLYANYINRQKAAVQTLLQLRRRKSRFQEFLNISERCCGNRPVHKLMEGPLFRLPQYIVFLAALLSKLPDGTDASVDVLNAIRAIHQVADHVSNNLKDDAQRRQVVKFQEKLFKGSVDLVSPSRLVLKFGELDKMFQKKSRLHKSKRYLFVLFNDMLLYASIRTAVQSSKVKHVLQLSDMSIADIPEKPNNPIHNAFFIVSKTKPLTIVAKSAEDKLGWMEVLNKAIGNYKLLQSELVGQPVPADGVEFEKMILKKKYRTVIHQTDGKRGRRVQSMFDPPEASKSISVRPMPTGNNTGGAAIIAKPTGAEAIPPPSEPFVNPTQSDRHDGQSGHDPPEPVENSDDDDDDPVEDRNDPARVTEENIAERDLDLDILPPPPPPPPPFPLKTTLQTRRNSAPTRCESRRSVSVSAHERPAPTTHQQPLLFLSDIRAGKELRKVVAGPKQQRTPEFERDLHVQLQSSLDRYRRFVQHDDDDLSESNSWE